MSVYACPTPCDADCEAACHESHDRPHVRAHSVTECERRVLSENLNWLAGAGFDVVAGVSKAPGMVSKYVAIEHLDFEEPQEFRAGTLAMAMQTARAWSERAGYTSARSEAAP